MSRTMTKEIRAINLMDCLYFSMFMMAPTTQRNLCPNIGSSQQRSCTSSSSYLNYSNFKKCHVEIDNVMQRVLNIFSKFIFKLVVAVAVAVAVEMLFSFL